MLDNSETHSRNETRAASPPPPKESTPPATSDEHFSLSHLDSSGPRKTPPKKSKKVDFDDDDDDDDEALLSTIEDNKPASKANGHTESNGLDAAPDTSVGGAAEESSVIERTVPRGPSRRGGRILRARNPVVAKPKKPTYEAWDSDLDTDENREIWRSELTEYAVELADRLRCIDEVYEEQLLQKEQITGKRLSQAYRRRYEPVMARIEYRETQERVLLEKRAKEKQQHDRKRKEREIENELLGTLLDDSPAAVAARAKSTTKTERKGKGSSKHGPRSSRGRRTDGDELVDDDLARALLGSDEESGIYDDGSDDMSTSKLKRRRVTDQSAIEAAEELENMLDDSRASSPPAQMTPGPVPEEEAKTLSPEVLAERREKALGDAHRRIWTSIARKDVPRVYRTVQASATNKALYWRRVSSVVAREAKRGARTNRTPKDQQLRARRIMREMLVFWKRNEKEERELRKKAEKEALEKAKKEEEMREAKRQARKLNFLITQTELYSHFVGNKLKTNEAEESEETSGAGNKVIEEIPDADAPATVPPIDESTQEVSAAEARLAELRDLDFDDEDEANLRAHARRNAEEAVAAAKSKASAFDEQRKKSQAEAAAAEAADAAGEAPSGGKRIEEKDLGKAFDQDDMNFLNPTSMGEMQIKQPKMLNCQLKEYQLKGLNWLANLYDQGINGILADEMGLGKTVQSIALMAYLAEVHDIWGPFLVIAPASTLHNWQQEITKFVPTLKALPYWGNVKDRTVLRKFWNRKQMSYHKDAPFHVLVTSYQLVVSDEKYFQRVKWQYMVLDEAQAIKSSSSIRWKTLLSFNCRNRLLLTGTPVQNSMQELWALLHFIMPSLFDSHDEFSEWFSKDIESHAENKGTLNEHQLRRLHMILKPFMLRRIKKNVQNELGDKVEIDVFCDMSARQRVLYRGLRSRVSVAELISKASANDEAGLKSLMNLVMQFRKVCNHPELFERADVEAPLAFARFAQSGNLAREGDLLSCAESTTSLIEYNVPKLFARHGGFLRMPGENTRAGFDTHYLGNLMNIWRAEHVHTSLKAQAESEAGQTSAFSFVPLLDLSAGDLDQAMHGKTSTRIMDMLAREIKNKKHGAFMYDDDFAASSLRAMADVRKGPLPSLSDQAPSMVMPLDGINAAYRSQSYLSNPSARQLVTSAVAPPIELTCSDGPLTQAQDAMARDEAVSKLLYGLAPSERESEPALEKAQLRLPGLPPNGLLRETSNDQLPASDMQVPQMNKLIIDSSKLSKLDELLRELKAGGHRVLIYFQMTRMIDLLEEYLVYRQYKYLRLDGSSKISERRDMVTDWQTRPELFIFLLSTRAGGLGINLTAADTVIFYDHDWNPSNDSQAMDRAHRLGQTKQVTVYRLITKNTIDERIVKLARNKKEVQDIVVGNKAYSETGMARPQEIVSLLLDDDQLADSILRRKADDERREMEGKQATLRNTQAKRRAKQEAAATAAAATASPSVTAAWAMEDDEDDFFGAKVSSNRAAGADDDADGTGTSTPRGGQPAAATKKKEKGRPGRKPKSAVGSGASTPTTPMSAGPKRRGRPSKAARASAAASAADMSVASSAVGTAAEDGGEENDAEGNDAGDALMQDI